MTPPVFIGETPFKLTYRVVAVIPLEIDLVFNKIKENDKNTNQERFQAGLNFLKKIRKRFT